MASKALTKSLPGAPEIETTIKPIVKTSLTGVEKGATTRFLGEVKTWTGEGKMPSGGLVKWEGRVPSQSITFKPGGGLKTIPQFSGRSLQVGEFGEFVSQTKIGSKVTQTRTPMAIREPPYQYELPPTNEIKTALSAKVKGYAGEVNKPLQVEAFKAKGVAEYGIDPRLKVGGVEKGVKMPSTGKTIIQEVGPKSNLPGVMLEEGPIRIESTVGKVSPKFQGGTSAIAQKADFINLETRIGGVKELKTVGKPKIGVDLRPTATPEGIMPPSGPAKTITLTDKMDIQLHLGNEPNFPSNLKFPSYAGTKAIQVSKTVLEKPIFRETMVTATKTASKTSASLKVVEGYEEVLSSVPSRVSTRAETEYDYSTVYPSSQQTNIREITIPTFKQAQRTSTSLAPKQATTSIEVFRPAETYRTTQTGKTIVTPTFREKQIGIEIPKMRENFLTNTQTKESMIETPVYRESQRTLERTRTETPQLTTLRTSTPSVPKVPVITVPKIPTPFGLGGGQSNRLTNRQSWGESPRFKLPKYKSGLQPRLTLLEKTRLEIKSGKAVSSFVPSTPKTRATFIKSGLGAFGYSGLLGKAKKTMKRLVGPSRKKKR
jgi:hypothetical protein